MLTQKRKLALTLALCVIQIGSQTFQPEQSLAADNKIDDKNFGYSLELPPGWSSKSDPIVNVVAAPANIVKTDNPFPNIKVVARSLPGGQTLDSLTDTSKKQWQSLWKLESDNTVKVNGVATRRLVLQQIIAAANQRTKVLKVFAVKGDNYYIISCADKPDNFEKSRPLFEAALNSLKFTGK